MGSLLAGEAPPPVSVKAIALNAALALVCVHVGAVPLTVLMELATPRLAEKFWFVLYGEVTAVGAVPSIIW
jgi:hypothetical protein